MNDLLFCVSWMPLINDISMILTLMYVCQHSSRSQPTSRKCKQWISTSSSPLCTTASIPSRLAECSFFCFVHHVFMMHLTSNFFPLAVFWHYKTFRERIWVFLQTPVFKFCPLAFSPVCPEGQIQYSKKAHPSTVKLYISEPWNCWLNLYCIKGILQSWKDAFVFVAACSGGVGLLVNLKGFFLIGRVGIISSGLELLQEGSQELLALYRPCYVVSSGTVQSSLLGRERCHIQTHVVQFLHPLS